MPAKILIVDDEVIIAEGVRVDLGQLGYAVTGVVSSAPAVLAAIEQERPDLVLMDINLGGNQEGIATAEAIRTRHGLPVVYVTAYADSATLGRAKITHPFGYVTKPFETRDLHVAIEIALHNHALEQRVRQSDQALRESERRQRAILDNIVDPAWLKDREGRFLAVNRAWCAFFNREEPEVIGKTDLEILPEGIAQGIREQHLAILASGESSQTEQEFTDRHGRRAWFEVFRAAVRNEEGEITGTVGIARNISRRKQAETEIRHNEARLRQAQSLARLGFWEWDPKSDVTIWSDEMLRIYGITRGEFTGRGQDYLGFTHPDDRQMQAENIRRDFAQASLRADGTAIVADDAPDPKEFRIIRQDGAVRWVCGDAVEVVDAQGRPVRMHGVLQDITERKLAEAALRESEFRYRQLVDNSPAPILVHQDGRFVLMNTAAVALFGARSGDELIGAPVLARVHPDFRDQVTRRIRRLAEAGETTPLVEEKLLRLDGSVIEAEVAATAFVHQGRPAVQIVIRDMTERIRAEAALARDEAELAAIYDHAPVMMLLIDGQRKVRRLNRAALEFASKTPEASVGLHAGDVLGCLHALDDSRGCGFGPGCADCLLRRATLDSLKTGATHTRLEVQPRFVRGREVIDVTLLASSARVAVADEAMVLLCLEDVSQQKFAEQRVREQAALLDVTRDAIVVVDLDGQVTYWNRGAEELYGWSAAEALGVRLSELIYGGPSPEAEAARECIRRRGQWSGELRQRSRRGDPIVALGRGVLMRDAAGEARSILLTASDITEAKRMEVQFLRSQRLDSLGSLATGVAHDLNNVFTPIMMSVEMLRPLARDSSDRELIQLLGDSVRRGSDIVRQLLLFGRGSDTPGVAVKVTLVINELRRMIQETFPKHVTLSIQAPADLWEVHGDQTQLHQVLLNLCVNARDAMPHGGRLALSSENVHVDEDFAARQFRARPGPHVFLRVTDTGTGIAPEVIDQIFDPFFTTKPIGQGTGLGLSTALGIVRSQGGFITVKSQPGVGSEFGVYLPALASVAGNKVDDAARDARRGRGELVLVVDDEDSIRQLVQRVLQGHGYEVLTAVHGQDALGQMATRGNEVRLIVTDVMMPVMDGLQAVTTLRRTHRQVPVVAVSGLEAHRIEFDRLPLPRVRHLRKPFSSEELLLAVREALDHAATP